MIMAAKCSLIVLIILSVCLTKILATKDLYDFVVSRVSCEGSDPRVVSNFSCSTHIVNRTVKSHDMLIFSKPSIKFNQIFVLVNYLHRIGNVYRRPLVSMEENFCGFLDGTAKSHLIRILWPALRKSSNLGEKCPYSGIFNISGLVFDDSFLPPALPEGQARIDIHVRNGPQRTSILKVKFYIEIIPKGAVKLDF